MKIQKIEINNLFDQFDYDIPLTNPEDLLILTAPNGFGKTMILNIIDNLFNKKFYFFQKLVFDKITLKFEDNTCLQIVKQKDNLEIVFVFYKNSENFEDFIYSGIPDNVIIENISKNSSIVQIGENQWIDSIDNNILTIEDIRNEYTNLLSENISLSDSRLLDLKIKSKSSKISNLLTSFNVYLIKEQRLFKKVVKQKNRLNIDSKNYMNYSIKEYAKELRNLISNIIQKFFLVSQDLDSSFPKRLLNETIKISEKEFTSRFEILRQKQAKLKEFGLSESEQEIPNYDETNAKVLLVYLSDTEQKISIFDELIQHLDLFTTILNERRFTFKTIQINKEKGFHFVTNKGKELSLTDLSSGEQHEVVLLYELIFRTTSNTLVLIDEPEISLHITWQKEFLKDLLAIIELQKMQVIVATHSPSIINDRWDLVFNLQTQEMQ